jgi:hypothetical protein
MSRIRAVIAVASVVSLAFASVALAATKKVTGGTSKVTPSKAAVTLLASNHISVTPIAPATASGGVFTFPLTGGRVNTTTFRGVIRDGGGISLSNGTRTVQVRRIQTVSDRHGVFVFASVRHPVRAGCHSRRHVLRCILVERTITAKVARVTKTSVSGGSATGTLKITAFTADVINRLAGHHVVSAGATLGSVTVTPTLS